MKFIAKNRVLNRALDVIPPSRYSRKARSVTIIDSSTKKVHWMRSDLWFRLRRVTTVAIPATNSTIINSMAKGTNRALRITVIRKQEKAVRESKKVRVSIAIMA